MSDPIDTGQWLAGYQRNHADEIAAFTERKRQGRKRKKRPTEQLDMFGGEELGGHIAPHAWDEWLVAAKRKADADQT